MKLEEGMYVRLKKGVIERIRGFKPITKYTKYNTLYFENISGATTWDNDGNVLDKQVHIYHNGYDLLLREKDIKSIVTKEQFSKIEYKAVE